jgi:hypothetical protein
MPRWRVVYGEDFASQLLQFSETHQFMNHSNKNTRDFILLNIHCLFDAIRDVDFAPDIERAIPGMPGYFFMFYNDRLTIVYQRSRRRRLLFFRVPVIELLKIIESKEA